MSGIRYTLTIPAGLDGGRLDRALTELMQPHGGLSRTRVQALLRAGNVRRDGLAVTDGAGLAGLGEVYELEVPPPVKPDHLVAQDIPVDIVFEDEDVIVINKPAGLVVHPAAGNREGTLVNALLFHRGEELSGIGGEQRPGIVHRLDKDTSGLMVVARNDRAHQGLSAQFSDHTLSRTYLALVWGVPAVRRGTVQAPVGRSQRDRKKMAVVASGRGAITHYEVQQVLAGGAISLLRCRLETGRTHQIRVHLSHIGHSLVGDPVYGVAGGRRAARLPEPFRTAVRAFARQALHAAELEFTHPQSGKALRFTVPFPTDLSDLIDILTATKTPSGA